MKALERRVQAMEGAMHIGGDRLDLESLTTLELGRLERIVLARDAGTAIEDMPADDLRFLAGIRVIAA